MIDNGLRPVLYLPSVQHEGYHETDVGVPVRFLPCARWYRPIAKARRAFRATRWSLYAQEQVNALAFHPSLRAALAKDRIDLLYQQDYWNGRFDFLSTRAGVPLVAMDHGGIPQGVVKLAKRRSFARAAAILCQTRDELRQVERYGGRPLLQSNGCDTDFFRPPREPVAKSKTILTVARLTDKQKRTSDLIRALPLLDADWSLDIVGNGPDRDMLAALAARLGVADRVRFRGFRGRAEVRDFCRGCGVYAMPSENEGICLAMLEAMACGAAAVATRIRSFETVIEHDLSGLLVPVGDTLALAAAIGQAWDRRDALGPAAADRIASHFDNRRQYELLADRLRVAAGITDDAQGRPPVLATAAGLA